MYLEDIMAAVALTLFCSAIMLAAIILSHPEWLEVVQ
jgi:hypothetical protein